HDIPQLRQLIDTRSAQNAPKPRDARVVSRLVDAATLRARRLAYALAAVRAHGPEFDDANGPPQISDAFLTEQDPNQPDQLTRNLNPAKNGTNPAQPPAGEPALEAPLAPRPHPATAGVEYDTMGLANWQWCAV